MAFRERRHILIVDDEESLAHFLRQGLLEADPAWQIDLAANGEEAVIRINRYAYGLIIADLRMPGLNGLELIQMVRALEPATRVILMTAYGSPQVEEQATRLRVFRYISKPFDVEDMKHWATEALQGWSVAEGATDAPPASRATPAPKAAPDKQEAAPAPQATPEEAAQATEPLPQPGAPATDPRLSAHLAQLRYRLGSPCLLLADRQGQVLAEAAQQGAGDLAATCRATLLPAFCQAISALLSAGNQEATVTLAGAGAVSVGDNWLLLALLDQGRQASGLIAALQGAAQGILALLQPADPSADDPPPTPAAKTGPSANREASPSQGTGDAVGSQAASQLDSVAGSRAAGSRVAVQPDGAVDNPAASQPDSVAGRREPDNPATPPPEAELDFQDGEGDDEALQEGQVFSLEQAQALGLIDEELLGRILGEQTSDG